MLATIAIILIVLWLLGAFIVGKGGKMIKDIGTDARRSIEAFLEKKIYLELHVRVSENWKDNSLRLRSFGYRE